MPFIDGRGRTQKAQLLVTVLGLEEREVIADKARSYICVQKWK